MRLLFALALAASLAPAQEVARPRILGVAHIGFYAHDLAASRAFYTDLLGYQEPYKLTGPEMLVFKINDRQYVKLYPEKQPNTDRLVNIALETDNAAQLRAYLASKGIKVPDRVTRNRTGDSSFTVTDPDGHLVEFVQYEPDGLNLRAKGKFMDDRRLSGHMSHVGIIVNSYAPAWKFYHDILAARMPGAAAGTASTWTGSI